MGNAGQQLVSGGLSGFTSTIVLQPFDLLKTRVQQGDGKLPSRAPTFLLQTIRDITHTNGLQGLWRGTNASLIRNIPGVALYMTSLTQLRTFMSTSPHLVMLRAKTRDERGTLSVLPKLSSTGNLIAGATARVAVGFLLNPFSVLKARYESNMYQYSSLPSAITSLVRLGPSELLRGFSASALRDAPYAGLFVLFYEGIKNQAGNVLPHGTSGEAALIHSGSAALAGALATVATHPFDVIKTKIQVRSEDKYHGFMSTVRTITAQRGLKGYFDGVSLRLSRKVLSSAIGWAVYEGFLSSVGKRIPASSDK